MSGDHPRSKRCRMPYALPCRCPSPSHCGPLTCTGMSISPSLSVHTLVHPAPNIPRVFRTPTYCTCNSALISSHHPVVGIDTTPLSLFFDSRKRLRALSIYYGTLVTLGLYLLCIFSCTSTYSLHIYDQSRIRTTNALA
jgi:hypothetical protein